MMTIAKILIDIIFSMREPGRKKFQHVKLLGYQTIEPVERGTEPRAGGRAGRGEEGRTGLLLHVGTDKRVFAFVLFVFGLHLFAFALRTCARNCAPWYLCAFASTIRRTRQGETYR